MTFSAAEFQNLKWPKVSNTGSVSYTQQGYLAFNAK